MLIVDEAHSLPPATKEQVMEIASLASNHDRVLQFLLAGQPALGGAPMLPSHADDRLSVRARLLPLERDECERYIIHRLAIGGGNAVTFSTAAIEVIYALSGGVPRLVNLLCERALQEGADARSQSHRAGDDRVGGLGARSDSTATETISLVRDAASSIHEDSHEGYEPPCRTIVRTIVQITIVDDS